MRGSGTIKKIIAFVLVIILACTCLAACGNDQSKSGRPAGTIVSETDTERTIVDQAGREVTVKKDPESIALCYRVVTRILLSLNLGEKITGVGKNDDFIMTLAPYLEDTKDVGMGVADVEALAELNPDIFFGKASDLEGLEAVSEIGIPAVGVSIETPEEITEAIDVIGKACYAEDRAAELIEYYNNEIKAADKLTENIKDKDRKTAIVMGSSIGKVADGTMLQGVMLEHAGAINCAAELEASELWPTAGAEQIFVWDPDYIFITNSESAVYDADDIMKDKAWSEMKAVKNHNVYVMPSELDSWEFPGIVSVLGIDYMIHQMYPKVMSDEELEQKANELYEKTYGKTFSREELEY